jgi:Transcription factor Tfb2
MVHFLLQTGLMQADPDYRGTDPDEAPLVITESGYDLMLQDNHQQVWHFVAQYLRSVVNGEKLRNEALLLLICLSFAEVGGAYLASSPNKNSRDMIKHFSLLTLWVDLCAQNWQGDSVLFHSRGHAPCRHNFSRFEHEP